jgi:hypothetical protein
MEKKIKKLENGKKNIFYLQNIGLCLKKYFSHKKEENSKNLNNSNTYKIKDNQIKNFKNIKSGRSHKNKKFKK